MSLIIGIISFIFTFSMSVFQLHKVLRNDRNYKVVFTIATLLPLLSLIDYLIGDTIAIFNFLSLGPICFLVLYKVFDKIILLKHNRHIYFYTKHSQAKESIESTWEEFFYQTFLFFIPFFLIGIGQWILRII
ncbi:MULTISPECIES: hypothetical protein [unclassified Flavobacterium]|uniref:hypothetical protein n=1 Tax=unclassified Flavobacterium TaxID=196869 RepID=UPI00361374E4